MGWTKIAKKNIFDHFAILVCFGSIISKTSPKLDHFDENVVKTPSGVNQNSIIEKEVNRGERRR